MLGGEELYGELGEGGTASSHNSHILDVIRYLQQKLLQPRKRNERLLKASEENEHMIRELIEKSNHKSVG